MWIVEYSFLSPFVQKSIKNRPRNVGVIIENKVARFYGPRCILSIILLASCSVLHINYFNLVLWKLSCTAQCNDYWPRMTEPHADFSRKLSRQQNTRIGLPRFDIYDVRKKNSRTKQKLYYVATVSSINANGASSGVGASLLIRISYGSKLEIATVQRLSRRPFSGMTSQLTSFM